jgi:serine/threonine protein kinase
MTGRAAELPLPEGGVLEAVEVRGFKPAGAVASAAPVERSATLVEAAVDRNARLVTYAAAVPKKPAEPIAAPAPKASAPTVPPPPAASPAARPVPKPAARPAPKPAPKAAPNAASRPVAPPAVATPAPVAARPAPESALPPPTDPFAGRRVALKLSDNGVVVTTLVNPEDGSPPQVVKTVLINDDKKHTKRRHLQKFLAQYATMQSIDHPNVARVFGQGLSETHLYVVQEYCPGGDLCNLIAQKMAVDDVLKAMIRIAGGLRAVHQKGFIHGDLRPANVLIREDGSFAVADFALASAVEYAVGEGESGVMLRSPEYLSPEMINGAPADVRSDIYCLGLLLHEMLTGQRPYASPDLSRVMMDHLHAAVPVLPAPHERLQPLLEKLMAKTVAERFASVHDVIGFMGEARLAARA